MGSHFRSWKYCSPQTTVHEREDPTDIPEFLGPKILTSESGVLEPLLTLGLSFTMPSILIPGIPIVVFTSRGRFHTCHTSRCPPDGTPQVPVGHTSSRLEPSLPSESVRCFQRVLSGSGTGDTGSVPRESPGPSPHSSVPSTTVTSLPRVIYPLFLTTDSRHVPYNL